MLSIFFFCVLFIHGNSSTNDEFNPIIFSFKKDIQQITLGPGLYSLAAYGAQGGNYQSSYTGGYGGYSYGVISLKTSTTLYVVVGGQGGDAVYRGPKDPEGGYNGGGNGYQHQNCNSGAGGGGATSISFVSGLLSSFSSTNNNILLVAGGGGGASCCWHGKSGGGANLAGESTIQGKTATLEDGFSFGKGEGGNSGYSGTGSLHAGGGGGGYFGGYAGCESSSGNYGGGGGSGYANTNVLTNIKGSNGINSGNGYAIIKPALSILNFSFYYNKGVYFYDNFGKFTFESEGQYTSFVDPGSFQIHIIENSSCQSIVVEYKTKISQVMTIVINQNVQILVDKETILQFSGNLNDARISSKLKVLSITPLVKQFCLNSNVSIYYHTLPHFTCSNKRRSRFSESSFFD